MVEGWKKWGAIAGIVGAVEGGIVAKDKYEESKVVSMSAAERETGAENIVGELESLTKQINGADKTVALSSFEANKGLFDEILDGKGKNGTKVWKNSKQKEQIISDFRNLLASYKESIAYQRGNERIEDAQAEINRMNDWLDRVEAGTEEKF